MVPVCQWIALYVLEREPGLKECVCTILDCWSSLKIRSKHTAGQVCCTHKNTEPLLPKEINQVILWLLNIYIYCLLCICVWSVCSFGHILVLVELRSV